MDLRSLTRQPPLDPGLELRLARAARDGDARARDRLVRAGLRLVALRALSLGFTGARFDDALQDGTEGLLRAVDRFDPDRGASLATFAWPWITGAILRASVPSTARDEKVPEGGAKTPESHRIDVERALAQLPLAQEQALRLRFGLDAPDGAPRSRRQVAEALGVTESAARRLEDRAVHHLRRTLGTVGDRADRSRAADPL